MRRGLRSGGQGKNRRIETKKDSLFLRSFYTKGKKDEGGEGKAGNRCCLSTSHKCGKVGPTILEFFTLGDANAWKAKRKRATQFAMGNN